jgi:poly(3-hydroxybutyrate) depolymerase
LSGVGGSGNVNWLNAEGGSGTVRRIAKALRRADRPAFRLDPAPLVKSRKARADGDAYLSRTFTCEAGSRNYNIYVPSHTDGWKRPLIIMLHGCTQNPDDNYPRRRPA